ncbi:GTPase [Brevibacterium yomogidense]|uniref:GTPase n=1 Tax=Brevibacterium yomogidense TaxID=946573 RepID=UPI0018DF93CC|nr:GTPase [Brevibacterium yomogidense]
MTDVSTPASPAAHADPAHVELSRLTDGLRYALDHGEDTLRPEVVTDARELLARVDERMRLGEDHTVVAFAGSTGSGKSSLFNAVAGLEIARVGVRRPTTSKPTACVWGTGGEEILDWLEVPVENRSWRESALDGDDQSALHGLILIDLPDHDSTAVEHRVESDRMVGLVDVVFWVVDPQKYADYSLHTGYLAAFAEHSTAMVFVLNQIDRIASDDRPAAVDHFASLLAADGLVDARVRPASAVTREGVPGLRDILSETIAAKQAVTERLLADVRTANARVLEEIGEPPHGIADIQGAQELVGAMTDAAGVDAIAQTVHDDYLRRAYKRTAYPVFAWMQRSKADPLGAKHGADRDDLVRAGAPEVTRAQRARVSLAAHDLVDSAVSGMPSVWRNRVAKEERASAEALSENLDRAITAVDVPRPQPGWWTLAGILQVLFFVATCLGLTWLVVQILAIVGVGFDPNPVLWIAPAVLLIGGVIGSFVVSAWASSKRQKGAVDAAGTITERLHEAVRSTAESAFLDPITAVVEEHRRIHDGLR